MRYMVEDTVKGVAETIGVIAVSKGVVSFRIGSPTYQSAGGHRDTQMTRNRDCRPHEMACLYPDQVQFLARSMGL